MPDRVRTVQGEASGFSRKGVTVSARKKIVCMLALIFCAVLAAPLATILNVLTITSMLIFMRVSKNKDISF